MGWIELERYSLHWLSPRDTFLPFPGLSQELGDVGGEHQCQHLGPEED